jgi:hypothetical protein
VTPTCACCGQPVADGFACGGCSTKASEQLSEIADLAPIARDVALGLIRRGNGNGGSGKADSRSPLDLDATDRLDAVQGTLTTLARDIAEAAQIEFAGPTPADPLRWACSWLHGRMEWARHAVDGHEPWAIRTFGEIYDCAREMRRLTNGPADRELVGMCDCGKVLYAAPGRTVVQCPAKTCQLRWEVAQSRAILRDALDGKLVTAAEAARLGAYLDTDRSQEQIRKLINAWSSRGMVVAHGLVDGEPTFRFGDVADRLAATPRRAVRETAEMGA